MTKRWITIAAAVLVLVGVMLVVGQRERPAVATDQAAISRPLFTTLPPPAAPTVGSFSARFALQDGQQVALDYIDPRNYRFSTGGGRIETYVLDGGIFLRVAADGAQPEQLWYYGRVGAEPAFHPSAGGAPALRPTTVPPAGVAAWGKVGGVFDTRVANAGPLGTPIDATVAQIGRLASAQWYIAAMLLPAMDMSLCGDGVQALTSWWPRGLTGAGYAVVATTAGVRLDGPLGDAMRLELPKTGDVRVHPLARI